MIKKYSIAVLLFLLPFCVAFSQDLDSLTQLSAFTEESDLQKDLNKATKVASGKALSTRETPGILSVISGQEIQNAGARDLIDVLRLVPGFDVGQDIYFIAGISMRGNWAHEGKVLVLLNGFQMNDLLYQNVPLLNHFPIEFIERIEIIRGPGSALYGGSAEYGVINIITKSTESLHGVMVTGTGGFHQDAVGRLNGGVMIAEHTDKHALDFSAYTGRGIVSDAKDFQDQQGTSSPQNLVNTTNADPTNLNFGYSAKGLSIRGMYDYYKSGDPFAQLTFQQGYGSIQYEWKASKKLIITPKLIYTNQTPWAQRDKPTDTEIFRLSAQRFQGTLNFNYTVSRKFSFDAGLMYLKDDAQDALNTLHFNGGTSDTFSFNNIAVYAQGLLKTRLANITVGFRYEKNSRTDGAFVPRLAFTKKIENFHFKALYSEAFRTPAIENINVAVDGYIKPERATVIELELGYQFTPEMLLTINGFSMATKDVMVYGVGPGGGLDEFYKNYSKTGTRGIEAVYSIKKKNWYANATYSYALPIDDNTVDVYQVSQTNGQYVGQLLQKFTLNSCFTIAKNLTVNPSFIFGGKRYAYTGYDDILQTPISTQLNPYTLINLFVNYTNVLSSGLTVGVGAYDVLNDRPSIPQAYMSTTAPIPGRGREWVVKVSYRIDFKK